MRNVSNGANERGKSNNIFQYNSLQCGYLTKYHRTTERGLNIIQFQRVKYLDISSNPHVPPAKHHVLKIDPAKLPGPLFTKKTLSYGYKNPHYKPKTTVSGL